MTDNNGWQPMETAPENEEVLVWCSGVRVAYQDKLGNWRGISGRVYKTKVTKWQPKPPPPQKE